MTTERRLADLEARVTKLEKEAAAATTAPKSVFIQPCLHVTPFADSQKISQEWHRYITESNDKEKHLHGLPDSTKEIIQKEIEKAKQNELIVGIDPKSYLAKEILWQSRKLIELTHQVSELTRSINRLKVEISKTK